MKENTYYEEILKPIVQSLPEKPGCYQYLNSSGQVIYVGKAKNLKRRVSSYFLKEQQSNKTKLLVKQIADIKYIVVNNEWDALLLENNLIKKYKPKYNILLKDDKTYPSICITNEPFPRIFKTRNIVRNGSSYYGPYSHVGTLNALLNLISEVYNIRTCKLTLNENDIQKGNYKECLEYHIKRCKAPCIGLQSKEEYGKEISEIREILKGRTIELSKNIVEEMKKESALLNFEKAQVLKEKYLTLTAFTERSQVVSGSLDNIDVYSVEEDEDVVFVNYMHLSNGCINQAFTFEYKRKLDETIEEMLLTGFAEMRTRYKSRAKEVIVPFKPSVEIDGVEWVVPQKGEKKKLLDLSILNVKQYRADRLKRSDKLNPEQKQTRILKELQNLLKIEKLPLHIECFDNSHISGSDAVAACVVYKNGKPAKKEYRLYNLKEESGGDDYASMYEVMYRRYSRMIEEGSKLPDLVIVDGGKGQMSIAKEVIDNLRININIAGLVKNNHHKTSALLFGFPQMEVGIKADSELFRLLEQMQEEVHRVAISFHKKKRSKRQLSSEFADIKGIGDKTSELLLKKFKSIKRIKEATETELIEVIGKSKASIIIEWRNNIEK